MGTSLPWMHLCWSEAQATKSYFTCKGKTSLLGTKNKNPQERKYTLIMKCKAQIMSVFFLNIQIYVFLCCFC